MWLWIASVAALQAAEVDRRVEALGAPEAAERDRACAALVEMGVPALGALRARLEGADPEVGERLRWVIARVTGVEGEDYGPARRVSVVLAGQSPEEALRALCAQAGFARFWSVHGELAARSEPVEGTFFEVVDRLCRECGAWPRYEQRMTLLPESRWERQAGGRHRMLAQMSARPLPVTYGGPVRIAVERIERTEPLGGGGDGGLRVELSVAWEPHVQMLRVENVVEEAVGASGEMLEVIAPGSSSTLGRIEVRLASAQGPAPPTFRLRGRIRVVVPAFVFAGDVDLRALSLSGSVRLGGLRFRAFEGPDGRAFVLLPEPNEFVARMDRVDTNAFGERVASLRGDGAVELRGSGSWGGRVWVALGVAGDVHEHPYEFDLPFPAFWPGSE